MKQGKRILALLIAAMFVFNCFPSANAVRGEELTLTDDFLDSITDVEYGSTDATYQFDDSVLKGVENDDEVYLVADVAYDSTNVGDTNISLTNFRLEGADAEYYKLPTIEPVVKEIHITPKVIRIAPDKTYIYYGQDKPATITEIADYSSQIVKDDEVNLSAQFSVESGNAIGNYLISIDGRIICDNDNYTAQLDDTVEFEVREYNVSVNAETEGNDYAGVDRVTLPAPAGFLISKDNQRDPELWGSSIIIDLEETQDGTETYYLRCNDASDTEHYGAISSAKTYNYTSIQTLPKIESIKVEKVDANSILNFLTFGVFGNGSVNIMVQAVGTTVDQQTTIYLGEDGAYDSKVATSELSSDGKYHYIAVFTYDVPKSANLNAYAVNSSGKGGKYAEISGISDVDGSEVTVDPEQFVLENVVPDVNIGAIESNNKLIKSDIRISDSSGIAKVEYGWDLDINLCDDNRNAASGHYLGFAQNNYTAQYVNYNFNNSNIVHNLSFSLELEHEDSVWVNGNKHTLYIRVTDNAGNVTEKILTDPVGNDMLPPNITSVEIRKAETSAVESVLRFFTFGSFSNDSVEIAITADDNEVNDEYYASGINIVTVNGRTMAKNDIGEYVLTVSADDIINSMKISVVDNAGWNIAAAVTNIPDGTGLIKSDDLIIENDKPTISLDFSSTGHIDNSGQIWYGAEDVLETLTITVADDNGLVNSGLYSLKISDNNSTIFEKTGFSSIDLEHIETYIIGNMVDGSHVIVVTAEDNAGNTDTVSQTFYIDCKPPESGDISIVSPENVTIDERQWFDKEENITFRVDSSDADSGLKEIEININGQPFIFTDDKISKDDNGYYVIVDTTNIAPDKEHKYTVTGKVTDVANNSLTLEPLIVYKDFENPEISRFTVEKKNSALDRILNVLTFGVYSNDTLIFKVYVSDAEFDSGVDYSTINYAGMSSPERMTDEGNGVFSYEIPAGTEVFESDIIVTAYDKYGKMSVSCPNIENAENGDSSEGTFVMIETIEPFMTLSLPASDSVPRTDDQIWYNSNKSIELSVQDNNSGIRNINFTVNAVDIKSDKNGVDLLKTATTELATVRNTEEQNYVFDTDYITKKTGEPADGKYSINIEISDNAGNIKVYEAAYYMDKIAPQIDKLEFEPATADEITETAEFIEELDYGFFFKTDFTVTVYVSDKLPSSGLNEVMYRFVPYHDGVKQAEITGLQKLLDGTATLSVPEGFKGQIFVEAFDNVANRSGEKTTKAYVVDNTAPNIDIINNVSTSYHDAVGNNLYVVDNSITVEITDVVSGIKEIGYAQSAEQNPYDRKTIVINNAGYNVGDSLGDGWIVSAVDINLVTKVTKTFAFSSDDNDVVLSFDATDNAINKVENVHSEIFTVDKTKPIINVSFRDDEDGDVYYNQNRIADITVIERNFDKDLIKVAIENTYGSVPSFSFIERSKTEHVAVIDFDEGDYTFDVTGMDLGYHEATVHFSGGNEKLFFVDKTKPVTSENFNLFTNTATENSFNVDKTINIEVTEHNFDPDLVNLRIFRKSAGADHNESGFADMTSEVLRSASWNNSGDVHTISFTLSKDAVYRVEVTPSDLAGNNADHRSTVVFEIDKTVPIVKAKNGKTVNAEDTEYLDIYSYSRKDDPAPSVEFEDLNIDHIKYVLTVYRFYHTNSEADTIIKPVRVYMKDDQNKTGIITGNKFVLPEFEKDGVYALELIAVDVAGNESVLNVNTYVKMVERDVLAYIKDSNVDRKTGLYSFQYENGEAISKRPDNFSDIEIFVMAKKDTDVDIVLRDNNGDEFITNAQATIDDSVYGMEIYNFTLGADYFKENFEDDTDTQLFLTVKNEGNRIDLGNMHIDNIAPTCDMPKDFKAWQWYYGEEDQTITISNISELIDESMCKVYDNGKEIAFKYSSEDNSLMFTLKKGWHNVGIILNDLAGNTHNIQEESNIHIGFFWLWVIIAVNVAIIVAAVCTIVRNKRKKQVEENN